MEGKNRCSSAGTKSIRKLLHKLIENLELPVHIDAERLKGPLAGLFDRVFFLFFRKEIQRLLDDLPKGCGCVHGIAFPDLVGDGFGQLLAVGLVRVLIEHTGQFIPGNGAKPLRRADAALLIQAKVQRAVHLEGKAPFRVVDLHGRYAQICQQKIKASHLSGNLINRAEVLEFDCQNILAEAQLFQPFFRLGGFLVVHVCGIDMPLSF